MKNINKYLFVNLVLILTMSLAATAQPSEAQRAKFHEEKVKYFNEKLQLSEIQKEKFWPLFDDFHNRMNKINEDEKNLLNYYSSNNSAMPEQEIDETIEKYMSLQKDRSNLEMEYHNSYVEILGKKKTMELYSLERGFRMHILETFKKGRPDQNGGRGGYGRGGKR